MDINNKETKIIPKLTDITSRCHVVTRYPKIIPNGGLDPTDGFVFKCEAIFCKTPRRHKIDDDFEACPNQDLQRYIPLQYSLLLFATEKEKRRKKLLN